MNRFAVVSWGSASARSLESNPNGFLSGLAVLDEPPPIGLAALDVLAESTPALARDGDGVRERDPVDAWPPNALCTGVLGSDDSSSIGDGSDGWGRWGGDSSVRSNGSGGDDGRAARGRL